MSNRWEPFIFYANNKTYVSARLGAVAAHYFGRTKLEWRQKHLERRAVRWCAKQNAKRHKFYLMGYRLIDGAENPSMPSRKGS